MKRCPVSRRTACGLVFGRVTEKEGGGRDKRRRQIKGNSQQKKAKAKCGEIVMSPSTYSFYHIVKRPIAMSSDVHHDHDVFFGIFGPGRRVPFVRILCTFSFWLFRDINDFFGLL